jgi:hypothetical protein
MKPTAMRAAFLLALGLFAAAAEARAPKSAELATVEEIRLEAVRQIEEKNKQAAEAARDVLKEDIEAYKKKLVPLSEYQKLVDIINNAKEPKVDPYRPEAVSALVTRFLGENFEDPQVRATRREIALKVLPLMVSQKDPTGLRCVTQLLHSWWSSQMKVNVKFDPDDKLGERRKSLNTMKKYLDKNDV